MKSWKYKTIAVFVSLVIASPGIFAEVKVVDGSWETGFLPFSKSATIINNRIVLEPTDAASEIEAGEGHIFVKLKLQFEKLSADDRSDAVMGAALVDAALGKHEVVAVFYNEVWRPAGFLDKSFRIIRAPETVEILFLVPRAVKRPLALVLGAERIDKVNEHLGIIPALPKPEPPRSMYCIFDGIKLREAPNSSADGDHKLHVGQKVTKIREHRGILYVTTDNAAGWIHPAALVDSRTVAERINSQDPKPNALFVATGFTAPSSFQLQIWHGGLELPGGKPEAKPRLNPGNCIVVSRRPGSSYTGYYRPFDRIIAPEHVGKPLILDRTGSLKVLDTGESWTIIMFSIGGAIVIVVFGLIFFVITRRIRRQRRETSEPSLPADNENAAAEGGISSDQKGDEMSGYKFNCPHCDQSLEASPDLLGQVIECPTCKRDMQLPKP